MDWTWSSPIAFGLFLLMAGGALVLLGLAISLAAGSSPLPAKRRR